VPVLNVHWSNAVTDYDATALMIAINRSNASISLQLMAAGADIMNKDLKPLLLSDSGPMAEVKTALIAAITRTAVANRAAAAPISDADARALGQQLFDNFHPSDFNNFMNLLAKRADVNVRGYRGLTPLAIACKDSLKEIVLVLLSFPEINVNSLDPDGSTPLINAIKDRYQSFNLKIFTALLTARADVNIADNQGQTALIHAILNLNPEAVNALLTAGAAVNVVDNQGGTALTYASQKGHIEAVNALLTVGANMNVVDSEGQTPLLYSIKTRNEKVFNALMTAGADVNLTNYALMEACSRSSSMALAILRTPGVKINVVNREGNTPLIYATQLPGNDVINTLLAMGADINAMNNYGRTALAVACLHQREDVALNLIQAGANINIYLDKYRLIDHPVFTGQYKTSGMARVREVLMKQMAAHPPADAAELGKKLLISIVQQNTSECMRLIETGADLHIKSSDSYTALAFACYHKLPEVALAIIQRPGVEIDAVDGHSYTPLMWASRSGLPDVVTALLLKGANINAQNVFGETALYLACAGRAAKTAMQLIIGKADVNRSRLKILNLETLKLDEMAAVREELTKRGASPAGGSRRTRSRPRPKHRKTRHRHR